MIVLMMLYLASCIGLHVEYCVKFLGSPVQGKFQPPGTSLVEGHQDGQRLGLVLLEEGDDVAL